MVQIKKEIVNIREYNVGNIANLVRLLKPRIVQWYTFIMLSRVHKGRRVFLVILYFGNNEQYVNCFGRLNHDSD